MSRLVEYELITQSGAAMAAADDDYFLAAVAITDSADTTPTLTQAIAAAARTITATVTDADASLTSGKLWLTGLDIQGRVVQETLTFTGGTETVESLNAFREITSAIYHMDGTAGGADTLKIGFGDTLGVPYDFAAVADILRARVDTTVYEDVTVSAGTWNTTYNTWDVLAGVIPNASRKFYIQVSVS